MKNKFSANILLCEKITEDKKFEGIFNNLILEDDKSAEFDIAIFLTKDIVNEKDEVFLLDLVFEEEDGDNYHPIGTIIKKCNKLGKSIEVSAFKGVQIDFRWEGLYKLELRKCKNSIDLNGLNSDEIVEFIKDGQLINDFTFSVERIKN